MRNHAGSICIRTDCGVITLMVTEVGDGQKAVCTGSLWSSMKCQAHAYQHVAA